MSLRAELWALLVWRRVGFVGDLFRHPWVTSAMHEVIVRLAPSIRLCALIWFRQALRLVSLLAVASMALLVRGALCSRRRGRRISGRCDWFCMGVSLLYVDQD